MTRLLAATATVALLFLVAPAQAAHRSECDRDTARPARCASVQVVGHRAKEGPAAGTDENTLRALAVDRRHGIAFETDQRNLADGTPVIFHDPTLARVVDPASMPVGVTGSSGPGDLSLAQWRQLRTKGGEPLPTLRQWIRKAGRWQVPGMVEIKYAPTDPAQVASWVRQAHAPVTFYHAPNVYRGVCQQTGAEVMRDAGMTVGLKFNPACPMTLEQAAAFGYSFVVGPTPTAAYVREAHGLGLLVGNYSGSAALWAALITVGADFIIAPHPVRLTKWLR